MGPEETPPRLDRPLKCYLPFSNVTVNSDGAAFPCFCGNWMRDCFGYGNIRHLSIPEFWNSEQMRAMRAAFYEERYTDFCVESICSILRDPAPSQQPTPEDFLSPETIALMNLGLTELPLRAITQLSHNVDRGCNLTCPMCRCEAILPSTENVSVSVGEIRAIVDQGNVQMMRMSGEGEIFAMREVVDLLASDFFSSRKIALSLVTNGTAFTPKLWDRIAHNTFARLTFSADGCSAATYEKVRVGASWEKVHANMEFAAGLRRTGKIEALTWQWVVMPINIDEMGQGVRLARQLGFDTLGFLQQAGYGADEFRNIFDDNDIALLDRIYTVLAAENALDTFPPVTERKYRTLDRRGQALAKGIGQRWNSHAAETLCRGLIKDCVDGSLVVHAPLTEEAEYGYALAHVLGLVDFDDLAMRTLSQEIAAALGEAKRTIQPVIDNLLTTKGADFWTRARRDFPCHGQQAAERITAASEVMIWGAGNSGTRVLRWLEQHMDRKVTAFVDSAKTGHFLGVPVLAPHQVAAEQRARTVLLIGSQFGFGVYDAAIKAGFTNVLNGVSLMEE